jgi:hypothetical protein
MSIGGIRVPLYAYDDTTTRNFCFLRTVAPQPQSLPVSVVMCRPFSCLSFRSGGLLSCTDSCHELTQHAPHGLRGKYPSVGSHVFCPIFFLFAIHLVKQSKHQSLRSLNNDLRYTTKPSIHLHSQQLSSHPILFSPWLSVLGLQSSSSSLAVVRSSAFLEQWDGSIVEKIRTSMAQTTAGDLPMIKATICER